MNRPVYLLSVLLLGLTACTTEADRQAEKARLEAADHQHCLNLGFEPKTEAYGNCRLKLREIRAKEEAARSQQSTRIGISVGVSKGF